MLNVKSKTITKEDKHDKKHKKHKKHKKDKKEKKDKSKKREDFPSIDKYTTPKVPQQQPISA